MNPIPDEAVERFFNALPPGEHLRVRVGARAVIRDALEASGAVFLTDEERAAVRVAALVMVDAALPFASIVSGMESGRRDLESAREKLL